MSVGFLISFGSFFKFTELLRGNPTPFVMQYSLGNIFAICSTCFLYGPLAQAKSMFASTRYITTLVYFSLVGLTLFVAFSPHPIAIAIVILLIAQYLALAWYGLSYVPWGRDLVKSCFLPLFCNCISTEEWNECVEGGA